jgi:hypothetical protein
MDFGRIHERPWINPAFETPPVIGSITGMLTWWEKRMLYWLTLNSYEARGLILDQGSFLGGSTICFASALRNRGFASPLIHSYDLFRLGPFELERFFGDSAPPGNVTRQIFDANLAGFHDLLDVHEGDLLNRRWPGDPIEILFVDIAKTYLVWDHVLEHFFPSLIPGESLLILQDYLFDRSGPWHHVVMEKLSDYFEIVTDTDVNSVLFRYLGGLTGEMIASAKWQLIPGDERLRLMDRAIARMDTEAKRTMLAGPRQWVLDDISRQAGATQPGPSC